jgi:hypothetical protein
MPEGFDLYMVSIEWESENKIRNFIPSTCPLEPSEVVGNTYYYDTMIYSKIERDYYQVAIKSKEPPFLHTDRDTFGNSLFPIPDTDFWILKGDWSISATYKRYYHCPSINTVGKLFFSVNGKKIEIDVNPNIEGFDFEALKDDFVGELWNLLTSNSSKAKIQASEVKFGDKVFRFAESKSIIDFFHEFEKISKTPKRELIYAINNMSFDKVKPVRATFHKLAVAGSDVMLPSKTFIDNFDIYENRFLCLMLYKIFQIVQYNSQFSIQQVYRLGLEIANINEKIEDLQKPQIVNKEQVLAEIQAQEKRIIQYESKWQSISNGLNYDNSANYHRTKVKLKHEHHQIENTYWCSTTKSEYCLIRFPYSISEYLGEGSEFIFELCANKIGNIESKAGATYPDFKVLYVRKIEGAEIELERNILRKQKQNVDILKNNNWQLSAILNDTEREKMKIERTNQIITLQKKIKKIEHQIKSLSDFGNEIEQFKPYFAKLLNSDFFKKINFKKLVRFKPSMTYIQNIHYRNALRYYQEILYAEGIDIGIFGHYEQITNYGIREMPQVFELWSLISIIRILENTFSYKHDPNDLRQLLVSISPQSKKIEKYIKINFLGDLNGRSVILHYQKVLSNNKRPDFLLEICCGSRKIFVVLDAKFKNYNYKKSATYETIEMVEKYKINSDFYVFILHPCKDLNRKDFTTKLTNFGGEKVFRAEGQVSFPFHNFGYLMIKPNQTDNLKKIIGMSLEYLIESDHNAKQSNYTIDPDPRYEMICLGCGNDKITKTKIARGTNRYYYNCKCENQDCEHNIHIDYCWNCKTKLFKHGSYWDYHRTSVWSIFDIHCPNCGMTLADRPNND